MMEFNFGLAADLRRVEILGSSGVSMIEFTFGGLVADLHLVDSGVSMTEFSLGLAADLRVVDVTGKPLFRSAEPPTYIEDLLDLVMGPLGDSIPMKSNMSPATKESFSGFLATATAAIFLRDVLFGFSGAAAFCFVAIVGAGKPALPDEVRVETEGCWLLGAKEALRGRVAIFVCYDATNRQNSQ